MVLPYESEDYGEAGANNINELLDVDLTNLANGEILKYNTSNGKWENGVGGGLEGQNLYNNYVLKYDTGLNQVVNTSLLEEYTATSSKISFLPTDGLVSVFAGKIEAQYQGGQKKIRISTNATHANKGITIDNNGRVGIGLSDPTEDLELTGNIQLDTGRVQRGRIIFYDKPSDHEHAEIDGLGEGTNGGSLAFYTKVDGGSVTEKLRINHVGAIGIGGEDYGTSGKVLTSQGSTTKPKWNYSTNSLYAIQLGQEIDGEATGDRAGIEVASSFDGYRVAIAARYNDGGGSNSGHVRVYEYDGTTWIKLGQDIDGEAANDNAYRVAMNSDGSRIIFGATGNDSQASNAGHARVFDYNGSVWVQVGPEILGNSSNDYLGACAISSDGSIIAVCASGDDAGGTNSGSVYIYEYNQGLSLWIQLGGPITGEAANDNADTISLNDAGTRIAIGARLNDDGGNNAGHVRVFDYNGSNWVQVGQDIDGSAGEEFGHQNVTLSADGSRLFSGGRLYDNNKGRARAFEYNGSNWVQLGQDIIGELENIYSAYGTHMSKDGTRIVVSGNVHPTFPYIKIFEYDEETSQWLPLTKDITEPSVTSGGFGLPVAISGDGNIVVAPRQYLNSSTGRTKILKLADAKEAIEYCLANL